jgi:hypothetical protein
MKVELTTPDEYQGDLIGDITRRRGMILSIEAKQGQTIVNCPGAAGGIVRLCDGHSFAVQGPCFLLHGAADV